MASVYTVNKGINRSIEFKGLKAQYIWYLGGAIVALLVLFAVLYIMGLPPLLCVAVILGTGAALVMKIYTLSHKYGEHGMMKALARKQLPSALRLRDRAIFIQPSKR